MGRVPDRNSRRDVQPRQRPYHAPKGADTIEQYKNDGGNQEIASFMQELQGQYRQAADRAKSLLGRQLSQGGQ